MEWVKITVQRCTLYTVQLNGHIARKAVRFFRSYCVFSVKLLCMGFIFFENALYLCIGLLMIKLRYNFPKAQNGQRQVLIAPMAIFFANSRSV